MPNWKGNQLGPQKTTKGNCPECGSNKAEKLVLDERFKNCYKCGTVFRRE